MKDSTLIRHARLYKRFLDVNASLGEDCKYYPLYYIVEKAADKEFSTESARKIIRNIQRDPARLKEIEYIIKYDLASEDRKC